MTIATRLAPRGATARGTDRGRVSVFLAGLLPLMLLFTALVWDASAHMRAVHRAENIASEAARAAGQAIDLPAAVRGEQIRVDPQRAADAAGAYLADVGTVADGAVVGEVHVHEDGRQVTVVVHIAHRPLLMTPWRDRTAHVTGHATAQLIDQ